MMCPTRIIPKAERALPSPDYPLHCCRTRRKQIFVKRRVLAVAIGFGALLVGALVAVPIVAAQVRLTPGALPIPDVATQRLYEPELETFLSEHPGPVLDFSSDGSIASLNAFYAAEVAWWNSVPWEAVAGQWGCSFQSFQASFNPPDAGNHSRTSPEKISDRARLWWCAQTVRPPHSI